jgi:hypothetical protein
MPRLSKPSEAKLWKAFSNFIRLRDADSEGYCKCFTCGAIRWWTDGDCGHGIGRQHKGTKYNERNNHWQCKRCNGFEGGKRELYKQEVDRRYGEGTWALMEIAARKPRKFSAFELQVMTDHYKTEFEKLKKLKAWSRKTFQT